MTPEECVRRFAAVPVVRLATAGADGQPHLVPVTFAADAATVVFAVDHKPKRTWDLRRLRNIAENPRVAFLADEYDTDWRRLWWVRADGRAHVVADGPEHAAAVSRLVARYPQYVARPPVGPVVVTRVGRWSGWAPDPSADLEGGGLPAPAPGLEA